VVVTRDVNAIGYVEVQSVTRFFGSTAALRGVSARFEAGSITFLEGPNGAGKSTLLAVMGTMLRPQRGRVVYGQLGESRQKARRHIGWVAHESHCYRDLTAQQNVELAARMYGVAPEGSWERVSRQVGAETLGGRRVGTLSRGQRQRVALARALVHDPSVLLLDEPWTGLDAAGGSRLSRLLEEERDRGVVVVVVSHALDQVERLRAGRLRLERGRVSQSSGRGS